MVGGGRLLGGRGLGLRRAPLGRGAVVMEIESSESSSLVLSIVGRVSVSSLRRLDAGSSEGGASVGCGCREASPFVVVVVVVGAGGGGGYCQRSSPALMSMP